MADYYNKNREGKHIIEQVEDFQKELNARDKIRQFPMQNPNSNSQSSPPWGLITTMMLLVLGGALIVKSISIPVSPDSIPSTPSNNSLPSLPSIAPSN